MICVPRLFRVCSLALCCLVSGLGTIDNVVDLDGTAYSCTAVRRAGRPAHGRTGTSVQVPVPDHSMRKILIQYTLTLYYSLVLRYR